MIRLIQFLIFGHSHKWKIIKESPYKMWRESESNVVARGILYTQECEVCGKLHSVTVGVGTHA